ncbi:LuxR C-terminal-related transcriptional regulator [Actinomadura luteofluorescens]|uniref:helix-turn-helix transcriptional regulator n=1 Tax=Actinomadura luteofluorescens TaxID=46163 RepID=UPI00363B494D
MPRPRRGPARRRGRAAAAAGRRRARASAGAAARRPAPGRGAGPHRRARRGGRRLRALPPLGGRDRLTPGPEALARRCLALLAGCDGEAEEHFTEALRLHEAGDAVFELARTELLFGHRLRRGRRPRAAREHLRAALRVFERYGAAPWTAQARAELRAAGETAPRAASGFGKLTAQQAQIARMAAEGATNREIAARLLLSPRTIDHHLRNVFTRLGIRSRVELARLIR